MPNKFLIICLSLLICFFTTNLSMGSSNKLRRNENYVNIYLHSSICYVYTVELARYSETARLYDLYDGNTDKIVKIAEDYHREAMRYGVHIGLTVKEISDKIEIDAEKNKQKNKKTFSDSIAKYGAKSATYIVFDSLKSTVNFCAKEYNKLIKN